MAESELAKKKCIPLSGDVSPLKGGELKTIHEQLGDDWKLVKDHHIEKGYVFDDFAGALKFTNKVGEIAESEGHHPDIYLAWGKVKLTLCTHDIGGLTESDFIMAAKADTVYP